MKKWPFCMSNWVACSFTFGAFAMPVAEECPVEIPVKVEVIKAKAPIPENVVSISVNTMEASEIGEIYELPIYIAGEPISYNQPLMGKNLIMNSFTVEGFSLDESYWFQLRVDCTTGDNVSLVGELLLLEKDGKLDYLFEGILRYNYR